MKRRHTFHGIRDTPRRQNCLERLTDGNNVFMEPSMLARDGIGGYCASRVLSFQAAFKTRFGVLLSLVYPSPSLYPFMFIHSTIGSLLGAKVPKIQQRITHSYPQSCILSPCLFNFYAESIMRNAGLEETQAGIKIARRNINHLRYADDTTLMAESEEC